MLSDMDIEPGCKVKKEKIDAFSPLQADPITRTSGQEQTIIKQEQNIIISSCTSLAWDQIGTNPTFLPIIFV